MKTSLVAALFLSTLIAGYGQGTGQTTKALPADTAYAVTERGANHRVWERMSYELAPSGEVVPKIHRYTELATGLHYKDANGQWQESQELIESYPGGAIARQGQYQVIFANNLNSYGAIDMQTPDMKRLRSNILGLTYVDTATGNSVMIAHLQNSGGQLISANQVLYTNAFDGVKADVRYTYRKSGFEQDVILREQPPAPEVYGLDSTTTILEVVTEFINPPAATLTESGGAEDGQVDDAVNWGATHIGHGKAFDLTGQASRRLQVPVTKRYVDIQGRHFLLERVLLKRIRERLNSLPLQSSIRYDRPVMVSGEMLFPKTPSVKADTKSMQLAVTPSLDKGYVLDYVTLNSSYTNFTFQCNSTYYISGNLNLYGTTTLEGGTVVKYPPNGPWVNINDSFDCQTAPYRPAVFTSQNDNSVGETISGSTGAPVTDHGVNCYFLVFDSLSQVDLHNIRMSYCYCGVTSEYGNLNLSDAQFLHTDYPVYLVNANCKSYNILMSDVQVVAFEQFISTNQVSHLTLDQCVQLGMNDWTSAISLTNCLLTGVSSMGDIPYATNQVVNLSTNLNVFNAAGAGRYYLATNSIYRDMGTTNVDPVALTSIRTKTTYPPVVYSNTTISTATTFIPQVQRDTNAPDLGYHYDPLDYAFGGVHASSNLTFTAGTAIGWFELPYNGGAGYGISLPDQVKATFNGTVTTPCTLARYDTVQEGGNGNWKDKGWLAAIIGTGSVYPGEVHANFTHCALLAGDPNNFRDYYGYFTLYANNCEFWSGGDGGYGAIFYLTNCLIDRGYLGLTCDCGSTFPNLYMRNCTMRGGSLTIQHWSGAVWPVYIQNSIFDGTAIQMDDYSGGNTNITYCDYNAFLSGSNRLVVLGTHDITNVVSFDWQKNWLGNCYLPTNSPLINAGSTTADQVGLYHFTTQTNQAKEANSTVDIGYHYMATGTNGGALDSDGDGVSDYLEDVNGDGIFGAGDLSDWSDYYNGALPVLTIVSGDNQNGTTNSFLPLPLTVSLTDTNAVALTNAPLMFKVTAGGALVAASTNDAPTNSLALRTDASGQAKVYALMPSTWQSLNRITAKATSGTNSVQVIFTASALQGIKFWLRADLGVTNSSGAVSTWADQSGNTNNATQSNASQKPSYVTNALNGLPVIRFNATNSQFFYLPANLLSSTGAEAMVVLKVAVAKPASNRTLWGWGGNYGSGASYYPANNGTISEGLGSTTFHNFSPLQTLTQYHLYDVAGATNYWAAWINGLPQDGSPSNIYGLFRNGTYYYLGYGADGGFYFDGDVAEVLAFNRVLTQAERVAVNDYLNFKYGLVTEPGAPTNLVAEAISAGQVSLTWGFNTSNTSTAFKVERKTGAGGTYAQVAAVRDTLSYVDTNLTGGTEYYYRVKAGNAAGDSGYSNETNATTPATGSDMPLEALKLWLKADYGLAIQSTNNGVKAWFDQSGNHNDATVYSSQPVWTNNALNGLPVVHFTATNQQYFILPKFLNGLSGAELFVALKTAVTVPSTARGLCKFGSSSSYPYNDGKIRDGFGSTSLYYIGQPAQPLTQYHIYNAASTNGFWGAWVNGVTQYLTTNNTYGAQNGSYAPQLGADTQSGYFDGDMAEVLVFNRTLTQEERDTVNGYLNLKYGLVSAPPVAPTNLMATSISASQVGLAWSFWLTNTSTLFKIERKAGTGGTYAQVAAVRDTLSYMDTNSLSAGTEYYYRVRASNAAGDSDYSNETNATTLASGADVPFGNLLLWLKADTGVVRQSTNNGVKVWYDQSGRHNDASIASTSQPVWTNGVLNGLPVIHFTATNQQYFTFPKFLDGLSDAEMVVVLKAAQAVPSGSRALCKFGASFGYLSVSGYPFTDGTIRDGFGSTSLYNVGCPAQPLTQYHLYNAASTNSFWGAWINGILQYTTTNNVYAAQNGNYAPQLGGDTQAAAYFDGDMAEVLVFNRTLTQAERDAVGGYLADKYGLAQYATNSSAPTSPTNFTLTGLASSQLNLQWAYASTNISSFQIERKLGTNGVYQQIGTVWPFTTNFVDTTAVPTNTYYYTIRAHNLFGDTDSAVVSPPTLAITNWPSATLVNATNPIGAWSSDEDGTVSSVQFFANHWTVGLDSTSPYATNWIPTFATAYVFTALATDNQGNSQYSAPVYGIAYLDSNGDGIPDYLQVSDGNDPLNPWIPPSGDTNSTPPTINLLVPADATLLP